MSEELESTREALRAAVAAASGAAELARLLADYQERLARAAEAEAEAVTRAREAEARLRTVEKQVARLAKQLAEQRYQTAVAQWRLDSVQGSKWSKLGDAIHTKNPTEVARTLRAPARKPSAPKRSDFDPAPPAAEPEPVAPVVADTAGPALSTPLTEGFVVPKGPLARPYLTVAAIVDRRSEALFRYEWRQVTNFGPDNWRQMLDEHRPHLLFVESVQAGPLQGNGGRWLEELAGRERGLRDLIEECGRRGIRTVFWHSGGPVSAAVPMASYFDHVLVTSEPRVREWRAALRHDRVAVLPHAVQPRVHNPVAAAGSRTGVGLLGAPLTGEPGPGQHPLIGGKATYDDILTAYRSVALAVAGPGTDARTLMEVAACATPLTVVPTPVPADDPALAVAPEAAAEAHRAWRACVPVTPLLDPILDWIGLPSVRNDAAVTAVAAVHGQGELDGLLAALRAQHLPPGQLVVVAEALDASVVEKAARAVHRGELVVREAGGPLTRGAALDRALRLADGDLVAVLDPRDVYGGHYLADLLRHVAAVDADIIGKASYYVHVPETGATLLRQPQAAHRHLPEVTGPTVLARRPALLTLGIADLSDDWDETLMRQCRADGIRVYSTDPYSYVQRRPATRSLLTSADLRGYVPAEPLALI
ncbi:hypothetical protein ABGB17_11645 [Sphaerisporangium sp. B11E5]|uniref:hypothetical protein n=1 Tax=Sphaerisporangium sp. B11E5 TaxID=3153563 RepID=UPI00325DCD96